MAKCNYCSRNWNSWGAYPDYCDEECFDKHWNDVIAEIAERYGMDVSRLSRIVTDIVETGVIKVNENY